MARRRPKKQRIYSDRGDTDVSPLDNADATMDNMEADAGEQEQPENDEPKEPREPKARKPKGTPMDEHEYAQHIGLAISQAERYVDETVAPSREQAALYYQAQTLGDEEEGRSQVVLSEVRDTILSILPDLLRIFCSGEKWGEYIPRTPEAVQQAEQAVDTVNYLFQDLNKGFLVLHSAFKDALLKKLGIITWWVEEEERMTQRRYTGMSMDMISYMMQQNSKIEILDHYIEDEQDGEQFYCVTVKIPDKSKKHRIEAVPPENFIIDRRARDPETACDVVGTREIMAVSDLIQMGVDADEIAEHGQPGQDSAMGASAATTREQLLRNAGNLFPAQDPVDESREGVKFCRVFIKVDQDGDGISELHEIWTIGDTYHVVKDEIVDAPRFALFCPDPEPHTVYGWSIADVTMDLQRVKSHIFRDILDSLGQTIFPTTVIVEGQVNVDDAMNKEVGKTVRVRSQGAYSETATPFVGQQAMPVLEYLDQIKAQRTGVTPASQGLDADLLQSTTKMAVNSQISAAQTRTEMIARIFAETGMTQLFKGLLRSLVQHQDKPMMVKLRGTWTPVVPSEWDPDMDVSVNVGLGKGDDETRMGYLSMIAQKQETILQTLGPGNPLTDLSKYRNTLARMTQLAGFKNPGEFWGEIPDELVKQYQAAAQQPKPDANMVLAQAEMAKVKAEAYATVQKIAEKRVEMQLKADLDRDKLEADVIIKAAQAGIDPAAVLQMINRPRPDITQLIEVLMQNERGINASVLSQIGAGGGGQDQQPAQPPPGPSDPPAGLPAPGLGTSAPGQAAPGGLGQ